MSAPIQLRRPVKHAVSPGPDSARAQALLAAERLTENLQRAVLFLVGHGVFVIGFEGGQRNGVDRVTVRVSASPSLHILLSDRTWLNQRQDGALTVIKWFAVRHGIRIEWEEICV